MKLQSSVFLFVPLCIECRSEENVRVSKLCKVDLMRKEKCVSSRQNECGKWQQFERVCQHKSGISEKLKIKFSGGFVQKQLVRKSPNEFLSGKGLKTQVKEFV